MPVKDAGIRIEPPPSVPMASATAPVRASPAALWRVIEGIGGETGWYSFPAAWAVRGVLDRLAGGVGLRRGRRDTASVEPVLVGALSVDPAARRDFWAAVGALQAEVGATILYTTHLTEEAESAQRVGLVDRGRLEAFDTPEALTERMVEACADCSFAWLTSIPFCSARRLPTVDA